MIEFVKKHSGKIALFAGAFALGLVVATTEVGAKAVGQIAGVRNRIGI